ncbi:IS5 family transposase [Streptomyces sp. MnatMP-M17]|uniref:IS5 family transposase n=1 Tax=unclassified Streptomyces TaxID=2593676 RepID=UPI00210D7873|nr:IS5 family transposase [Streptomyces sp. MnatMP-M17]
MRADLSKRLVRDELWELVAPLLPSFAARPQGGGTAPRDERAVFTAVVCVLTSACAWRYLPESFGVSPATAHRRLSVWTEVGLWRRLPGGAGRTRRQGRVGLVVRDRRCRVGAGKWGLADRAESGRCGKKGSKLHVLSEGQGLPLVVAVSGANLHDSQAFKALILGIPAIRSRRGPRRSRPVKVRADKAYYSAEQMRWLRDRRLVPRIARPGIESGERLGRHRWKIERSIAWLFGYRRLTVRYERKGSHFLAFLGLAAALTCYKRLAKLAT